MKDLDICILINNAGILYNGYFRDVILKEIMEMTVVNTYPYILLTKVLISKITSRTLKGGKRSCIINVSSVASTSASPYQSVYGCTKVFERWFSDLLRHEVSVDYPNVDILTIQPMYVSTQMTNNLTPSFFDGVVTSP